MLNFYLFSWCTCTCIHEWTRGSFYTCIRTFQLITVYWAIFAPCNFRPSTVIWSFAPFWFRPDTVVFLDRLFETLEFARWQRSMTKGAKIKRVWIFPCIQYTNKEIMLHVVNLINSTMVFVRAIHKHQIYWFIINSYSNFSFINRMFSIF